jgi:hypothetical protein
MSASVSSGSTSTQTQVTMSFTSAQLLALNTTPITLVAATGAGTMIIVESVIYEYTRVTTDYNTNSDGGIFYGTPAGLSNNAGSDDRGVTTAAINGGSSMIIAAPTCYAAGSSSFSFLPVKITRAAAENQPIMFGAPSSSIYSPYVGGDGTMTITIAYRILTL